MNPATQDSIPALTIPIAAGAILAFNPKPSLYWIGRILLLAVVIFTVCLVFGCAIGPEPLMPTR